MTKTRSLRLLGALFVAVTFGFASTASADTISFANTNPITITDGKASPYASSIAVSGIVETVVDVNVTLSGLTHPYANDLYFVLEGPGGALVLMNDAGGENPLFGVSVIFDDDPLLDPIPYSAPFGSGSYNVSQYDSPPPPADTAPAPNPGLGGNLGIFNFLDPNGTWNLYTYDDTFGGVGELAGGWSITFETRPIPEPTAAVLFAVGTFVVGGTLRRQRA